MAPEIKQPTPELIAFAEFFEKNYLMLSPGVYRSDDLGNDEKYRLDYLDSFEGNECPMRVSNESGIFEANKETINKPGYTPDFIFYLTIWCFYMAQTKDYIESDLLATRYYFSTGRSIKNLMHGYLTMFRGEYSDHINRMQNIKDLIEALSNEGQLKKETAVRIWNCMQSIAEAKTAIEQLEHKEFWNEEPNPRNLFGDRNGFELRIPTGPGGHKIHSLDPKLAVLVIKENIRQQEQKLIELNEQARQELRAVKFEKITLADPYAGELNEERIKAYRSLSDEYTIGTETARAIFDKGIDFILQEIVKRNNQK